MLNFRLTSKLFSVALACCTIVAQSVRADEPSVTAVLDNAETFVGQPVQLQIKVVGARNATVPNEIAVDGLDIRYSGQSQLVEGRNFQFSYSVIYAYTIMPEKAGTFKIPPQTIRVGGSSLTTPELTLNVADNGGGRSARSGKAPDGNPDVGKNGFVELILTKTNAYVGEMIPAEVRLGFAVRTPVESLGNGIDLTGQGFTTQKMHDPRQTIETIRGKSYQIFTFKTAIAPARSGKIVIGPVQVNPIVRVPQANRSRGGLRDPFSMNDPFFDSFFNDPAFAPSTPREVKLQSEPATLEVKALPPNPPPGFSGAVGIFTMTADAKPTTAQVGDPITVTAKVSGRGNFDRVTAPEFEDEKGWHKYPPSAQFKQDDDVGISGAKTFETVLSPNEKKDAIPASVFSYFDPVKEQYVTLRSAKVPARIEGGIAAAAASPAVAPSTPPANAPSSTPAPRPSPSPTAADLLYQLTDLPREQQSFAPIYLRRSFWWAQLLPLTALVIFIVWKIRRARADDREALRRAAWQRQLLAADRQLQRTDIPARDFFTAATESVRMRAALAKNLEPNAVDAEAAAAALRVDDMSRDRLRRLFAQHDEMRYSGGENAGAATSPDERRALREFIESLEK